MRSSTPLHVLARKLRRHAHTVALIAVAMATAACGGGGASGTDGDSAQGGDNGSTPVATGVEGGAVPDEAENETLTVAVATLEDQIPDPHLRTGGNKWPISWSISEPLVRREVDGELVPGLATKWSVSKDQLTWTFHLRKGVTYHDGSTLKAQDVVTAVDRVKGPDFVPYVEFNQFVTGAKAIDDLTVEIYTKEPYPTLPVDAPEPIPTEYYEQVGDQGFRDKPIGAGQFMLESQQLNSSMTFVRFDDFWDPTRRPNFEKLVLQIVPEESARLAGLRTGEIDIAHGLSANGAAQLEGTDVDIVEVADSSTAVAGVFDLYTPENKTPLTDVRVRKALLMAIDRQGIVDSLYGGYATVPQNITAPVTLGNLDDLVPYPYDPEEATRLLEQAKASDLSVTLHTYSATTAIPEVRKLADAVVGYWQKIGIDAKVDASDAATYLPNYRSHKYKTGLGILGFPSFGANEPHFYNIFYSPDGYYSTLDDPQVEKLLDEIATTITVADRRAVGEELSQYFYDELPGLPLVNPSTLYGVGPNVAEFRPMMSNPYAGPFWYLRAK